MNKRVKFRLGHDFSNDGTVQIFQGLVDPRLFPVDVSESKARLTPTDKVNRPHVLDEEDISIVVVSPHTLRP